MSKKIAYSEIKAKLEEITTLKTVRLWNNQVDNDNKEIAFDYPAVFVEFPAIEWESRSYGNQIGVVDVTLYICQKEFRKENINFFDLIDEVYLKIQGFSSEVISSEMQRTNEEQDTEHGNIIIWKQTYSMQIEDSLNNNEIPRTVIASGTIKAEITKVIDIDNEIIRTGDGDFSQPIIVDNYYISLNGQDESLNVDSVSGDLDFVIGQPKTFTIFVNPNNSDNSTIVFFNNSTYVFYIKIVGGLVQIRLGLDGTTVNRMLLYTNNSLPVNSWSKIDVVLENSQTASLSRVYINNVECTYTTRTSNLTSLNVFSSKKIGTNSFAGGIDKTTFYNKALNTTELTTTSNYGRKQGLTGVGSEVMLLEMGENAIFDGTNLTINDQIGNNNAISINMDETNIIKW